MRVSDLTRQKPVEASVDLGDGDSVTLVFDRNRVTPAWANVSMVEEDALSVPRALAGVLLSWDVTNDDGSPFAATAENIAVLSYPSQRALLRRIMEAAVPSDAEGKSSSVPPSTPPSVSVAPPPTPPNGQDTSESLEPSESLSQT